MDTYFRESDNIKKDGHVGCALTHSHLWSLHFYLFIFCGVSVAAHT